MAEPSLAARSRSSLVRAGSLTEAKLTTNALRQSEGTQAQRRRYDSLERPSKLANGVVDPPIASSNTSSVMEPGEFFSRGTSLCAKLCHPQCQVFQAPLLGNVGIAIVITVPRIP